MSQPERRRRAEYFEQQDYAAQAPEQPANVIDDAPVPPARDLLATNTGVRLACTMSAMIGLFALFLCWAEKDSRVIRRFSVQSAALTAVHAAAAVLALVISWILGGIPYFGLMASLVCLLGYVAVLILVILLRVQLMKFAWQGVRCVLPVRIEKLLSRFY